MNGDEMRVLAVKLDFDLGTLERDYAITCLLPMLFPREDEPMLVFKGGTALNKTYLGYRRLSEDLDFTCLVDDIDVVQSRVQEMVGTRQGRSDVTFEEPEVRGKGSMRVRFIGPLEFPSSVRIEISTRERPTQEPGWVQVPHEYADELSEFSVFMMTLDEMVSEKLRAAMSPLRAKPRDIMDLVFVEEVSPGILGRILGMARRKCEAIGQGFGVDLIAEKRSEYERRWVDDLRSLLRGRTPPDFGATFDGLVSLLHVEAAED